MDATPPAMDLKVVRNTETLRELALEKLRAAILEFRFRPGDRLRERDLCEQLGVSRSIVREVLRHLETEGLVETAARGPAVANPTPEQAREIYEIRATLEALAARHCAERADAAIVAALEAALERIADAYRQDLPSVVLRETHEFYRLVFEGGSKTVAWTIVRSLNARITHLRAITIAAPGRSTVGLAELRRIVDAIARKDGDAAHAACLDHVNAAAAIAYRALTRND